MKRIILASGSPRRHELLQIAGINHEIYITDSDETVSEKMTVYECAASLSLLKAKDAAVRFMGQDVIIIAADTLVEADGRIFGKPKTINEAACMLEALSGSMHKVFTGVTVTDGEQFVTDVNETRVFMREIDRDEIAAYIEREKPLDKAGAYGIQGTASVFVERIEGDYFNIVGLPLCMTSQILKKFGFSPFGGNIDITKESI